MSKLEKVFFTIGTVATFTAFVLAVIHNFIKPPASETVNWVAIGFILLGFVAYVVQAVLQKKERK